MALAVEASSLSLSPPPAVAITGKKRLPFLPRIIQKYNNTQSDIFIIFFCQYVEELTGDLFLFLDHYFDAGEGGGEVFCQDLKFLSYLLLIAISSSSFFLLSVISGKILCSFLMIKD